nr:uncharacterized protein CI109_006138 [Kwoniella shandongensis]KAA5525565.1 hypothetical protein CI109_006138 [Kwoniella shandongensis]
MSHDGDPWDLTSYHQDVQDAYHTLQAAVPALGSFKPLPVSASNVHQRALTTLQTFMAHYPPFFIEFVSDNYGPDSLFVKSSGHTAGGGLTRMMNPLLGLATKLDSELKKAEEWAEDLEESQELGEMASAEVDGGMEEENFDELAAPTTPPSLHPSDDLDVTRVSPSKRSIVGYPSDSTNKIRALASYAISDRPARPGLLTAGSSTASLYPSTTTTSTSSSTSTSTLTTPITSITESTSYLSTSSIKAIPPSSEDRLVRVTAPNGYQAMLYKFGIQFHVQWELERLINQSNDLDWSDFRPSDFIPLRGPALKATKSFDRVLAMVKERKLGRVDNAPSAPNENQVSEKKARLLQEVDREENSIVAGDMKGVGNDCIDWPYGGKIVYTIAVVPIESKPYSARNGLTRTNSNGSFSGLTARSIGPIDTSDNPLGPRAFSYSPTSALFSFQLRPPSMPGKSHRLARRFVSRRIITFKIKDCLPKYREQVLGLFIGKVFVVFGRPYRALCAPADGEAIFAIETADEGIGILRNFFSTEPKMPMFAGILASEVYNDLEQKPKQAMAKWASRLQILFSDSVPAASVDPSAITVIPDIVTIQAESAGQASTEQILTDGCGLMFVQMRLGGSKGLLALMSPSQAAQYPGKEVVLRESMVKALPAPEYLDDPSLYVVEVLRCESLRIGTTLSSEAIIAMAHGGVPSSVFLKLAEDGLNALRDDFLQRPHEEESDIDVLVRIHAACYRRGGVGTDRKKRIARAEGRSARVAGLTKSWSKDEVEEGEDGDDPMEVSASERFDVDPISGQPGGIAESLMEAVAAGFHPAESTYTGSKLHHLVDMLSRKMIREFKIPVDQSLSAFIVPDSLAVLAPDELFISFSGTGPIDPTTQCPIQYLEGPCLAFRSPCKLPTDVRKFTAVWKQELAHLKDCIVLSASSALCKRSPASYLGGGDYDGDTVQLFWGKELVEKFKNADDVYADVPADFEQENFDKQVVKGTEFLGALVTDDVDEGGRIAREQEWLLAGIKGDALTGTYSDLHGNAVYKLGYDHPETIRLARMFCLVLDARKSGLQVKADIRIRDVGKYSGDIEWRSWNKGVESGETNAKILQRSRRLGPFIMDQLMVGGKLKRDSIMADFPSEINPPSFRDYQDLSVRWLRARSTAQKWPDKNFTLQLNKLEQHVRACSLIRQQIVSRRLDPSFGVVDSYNQILDGAQPITTPRKGRSTHSSPVKQKADSAEASLEMLRMTRQLAMIWRDNPAPEEVPLLMMFGEEVVRELKISCAVCVPEKNVRARQVFPFDMDFDGMCAMKARTSGGGSKTVLSDLYTSLKPGYKGLERLDT